MEQTYNAGASSMYSKYPLDLDSDQIRLLKIHHGAWSDPVHCSISIASFSDGPRYTTLSYVWGNPEPRRTIFIDDQTLDVGPNAYNAIRRLRSRAREAGSPPLVIWIDAICIDQNSTSERNHQVAMMGKIYSQCTEVTLWLGEFSSNPEVSDETFITDEIYTPPVREPHEVGCRCQNGDWEQSASIWQGVPPAKTFATALSVWDRIRRLESCEDIQICSLFLNVEEMSAFKTFTHYLLRNPWFKRIWVVQEIVFAPIARVCIGPVILPFAMFLEASQKLKAHLGRGCCLVRVTDLVPRELVLDHFSAIGDLRERCRQGVPPENFFLLRSTLSFRRASLDHDLVYGMLGLCHFGRSIIPRYDRPVHEVFTEVSREFLRLPSDCECNAFAVFAFAPVKIRYPDLPSWAVDHTVFEDQPSYPDILSCIAMVLSSFNHSQHPMNEGQQGLSFQNNHLILCGRFLDSVAAVGETHEDVGVLIPQWMNMVLARHSPLDPYILPDGYASATYNWATAWLKTMCASHRFSTDLDYTKLTSEEIKIVLSDVCCDPFNFFTLGHLPDFGSETEDGLIKSLQGMARQDLYMQTTIVALQLFVSCKMFLSNSGYLGLGNHTIRTGDKIFLSSRCGRPVILRAVEGSLERWGRKTYRIVSFCYLEGFMEGPDEGTVFPSEEIWVE